MYASHVPQLMQAHVAFNQLSVTYPLALRSGITVASEVHPRRGYC